MHISRRQLLTTLAAAPHVAALPRAAQAAPKRLRATSRVIDIGGKPATILGLEGPSGFGLTLDPGERFAVELENALPEPTLIHWHGQIPPHAQDGVPDMPAPRLAPGETRAYDFAARPGTHWMHAHIPTQELGLLAAPLIVREAVPQMQEVTLFLQDFSFTPPDEILAQIAGSSGGLHGGEAAMDHTGMGHSGMGHSGMGDAGMTHDMSAMGGMDMGGMDLNDYNFDAYLANHRTLDDPEIVAITPGEPLLLRIVNAASATVFWIDTGALEAEAIAVDGTPVVPRKGKLFGLAMGQRLDLRLKPGAGAHPILARREGAREQTGLILASPKAEIPRLPNLAETAAPAFATLDQEARWRATTPLAPAEAAPRMVMLGGTMSPYRWTIDGATYGAHKPIEARQGERVELMFHNMSMMAHPMHLHGHAFQVVDVGAGRFAGALRDTVMVPPMAMLTVAFDAGEAAAWMLHCHHVAHMATGMMTELKIT
jgi:FtsP/CotA-like multicopper oxidase with cupredoxin domain